MHRTAKFPAFFAPATGAAAAARAAA